VLVTRTLHPQCLLDRLPLGIFLVSTDGRVLQSNAAMRELTGFSEAEVQGLKLKHLFKNPAEFERLWRPERGSESDAQVEGSLVRKDGECRRARMTCVRVRSGGRELVLFSALDGTSHKVVEERLRETLRRLAAAQLALSQKDVALAEIVARLNFENRALRQELAASIRESVSPILAKLRLGQTPSSTLDLLAHHLGTVTSSLGSGLRRLAPNLSSREIEISSMIAKGLRSRQIAKLLEISCETVEKHRRNIRKKLGISTARIDLVSYLQDNFIEGDDCAPGGACR